MIMAIIASFPIPSAARSSHVKRWWSRINAWTLSFAYVAAVACH